MPRQTSNVPVPTFKTRQKNAMPFDPSQLRDVQAARNYLDNIKRLGRAGLYPVVFRRLCELSGQAHDDPVAFEFWRAIAALEEILRETRGKTVRLARTRQKIARVGELRTIEDLALARRESDGFRILAENGLGDLSAEYIVVKHPHRFSPAAVAAARERLEGTAISLPPGAA